METLSTYIINHPTVDIALFPKWYDISIIIIITLILMLLFYVYMYVL